MRGDQDQTGEHLLVADRVGHPDRLTVELERRHGFNGTDDDLAERFGLQLKALTGVSADVSVLPPGSLPWATHKAKRV